MISIACAEDHAFRHHTSYLLGLHVGKDDAFACKHCFKGHVWLQAGENRPELAFSKVNLFDIELLRFGMWLTLNDLTNSDIALLECLQFLSEFSCCGRG